ncbi:MAG: zf-HC2 domain-containing protein [Actinomycetota bacterium]
MTTIDHERCSELLPAFERGELAAPEAAAVTAHLEGCPGCTRERAAVRALVTDAGIAPLTGDERVALHRGVLDAVREAPRAADILPLRRAASPWRARVGQVLAAAAMIAVIGVGLATVGGGLGGSDTALEGGGGGAEATKDQAVPAPETGRDAAAGGSGGALAPGLEPTFVRDAGKVSASSLRALGKSGFRSDRALNATAGETASQEGDESAPEGFDKDVDALAGPLLNRLARKAPGGAGLVRRCGGSVLSSQAYRIVPVYGAYARLGGRAVLVLGFRWSDAGGPLDRFMVWAWPRGSCDVPVAYSQGPIGQR